jgi:cellulase
VDFFKIDESTYNPVTEEWGSDQLIKDNNTRTMRIPSDIKPGMYVLRHELISLHFSFRENSTRRTSGAQHYPTCFKVQVIGNGTATPPGQKFPGAYHWNDKGILKNIYYDENRYVSRIPISITKTKTKRHQDFTRTTSLQGLVRTTARFATGCP